MLFSSLVFIGIFLPIVLIGYFVILRKHRTMQNIFLLITSLGFYAWGEPWFVFIMMLSIVGNWIFGLIIDKYRYQTIEAMNNSVESAKKKKAHFIISLMLIFNLTIIFIFKYLMFTLENVNSLLGTSISVPEIVLPIGISFFTFQAISYVIDVYRGNGQVQKNLLNVGLYISFFPQLIAGPIVRYQTVADQIINRKETWAGFTSGMNRFLVGFCKKILLANNFAIVANEAFKVVAHEECSIAFAWLGAIAYTLQIYYDFSGYSDMAIGLGRMFGFYFPENFNYPYISKSVSEFWRRWHISLGSWFRDYVYFPLGGSRVESKKRLAFNLFVVWLLTGIWHGANWTFIVWGLMYFVLILIEKLTGFEEKGHPVVKHIYTLFIVIIGWVIFNSKNMAHALLYISIMFGVGNVGVVDANAIVYSQEFLVFFIIGGLFSMPVAKFVGQKLEKLEGKMLFLNMAYSIILAMLFLLSLAYLVKGAYNPFIYFNF